MIFRIGRHDELNVGAASVDVIVSVQGVMMDSLISCIVHWGGSSTYCEDSGFVHLQHITHTFLLLSFISIRTIRIMQEKDIPSNLLYVIVRACVLSVFAVLPVGAAHAGGPPQTPQLGRVTKTGPVPLLHGPSAPSTTPILPANPCSASSTWASTHHPADCETRILLLRSPFFSFFLFCFVFNPRSRLTFNPSSTV